MAVWGNGTATKPSVSPSGRYLAERPHNRKHQGTDFVGYSELRAIEGGVVTCAGILTPEAGQTVAIDLPDPIDGCTVTIVRMHIAAGTIAVHVGDRVTAGHVIGRMGNTGNAEGNCDHVEIRFWKNGVLQKTVDPEVWIAARTAAPAALHVGTPGGIVQRVAKAASNGRAAPRTDAAVKGTVPANIVGNFDGFTHGERVEGNDVWFHGAISGLWFWSGAYTDPSPTGMKKL